MPEIDPTAAQIMSITDLIQATRQRMDSAYRLFHRATNDDKESYRLEMSGLQIVLADLETQLSDLLSLASTALQPSPQPPPVPPAPGSDPEGC